MKKIYSILVLVLCVMMALFCAQAAEVASGDTVKVPVSISNTGAYQITISISFDANVFDFVSISCDGPGGQASYSRATQTGRMAMFDINNPISSGDIGTITLTVKDNAKSGTYMISAVVIEAWDLNENAVDASASAGSVTVFAVCDHETTEEKVIKETDCENNGTKQIVCVDCGEVIKEEVILKLGHDTGAWTEIRKATCTENGEEHAVCARCGKECIQVLNKLGHDNGEWTMIKAATCAENGEESNMCNRCGESEHREIPAFGHDFGAWIEESEASCTVEGKKYRVCNRCNEREEYTGFAPGHHEVWKVLIPATREKEGLKQKICKRCNEILEEQIISKLAYTNKTASTIGLRIDSVAVPIDSNDAWKMLTPIDLTIQGTIRYPLIAGNVYEIGYVEVTIDDKMMNVELVIESDVTMDTTALVFLTDTEEFNRFSINDYEFYEFPAGIKLSDVPCDKLLMMVIGNLTIDPARPEPKYYNPKSAENKALLENLNEIYKQYFEEKK